jgi:hypothetical protein
MAAITARIPSAASLATTALHWAKRGRRRENRYPASRLPAVFSQLGRLLVLAAASEDHQQLALAADVGGILGQLGANSQAGVEIFLGGRVPLGLFENAEAVMGQGESPLILHDFRIIGG